MYDQRAKEGTWLFPIFGKGFDGSANPGLALGRAHQGLLMFHWDVWKMSLPFIFLWAAVLMALLIERSFRRDTVWPALLAGAGSACLGTFALNAATGADSVTRYTAPFQVPIIVALVAVLCGWLQEQQWPRAATRRLALATGALVAFFIWNGDIRQGMLRQYVEFVTHRGSETDTDIDVAIDFPSVMRFTHNLQNSVPPHEAILAATYPSFGFDARRNKVFVADFLGMAGPPPGAPITSDSSQLRRYLTSQHIRYIAYSRGYAGEFPELPAYMSQYVGDLKKLLSGKSRDRRHFLVARIQIMQALQACQIRDLSNHYGLLYDDGTNIVIDLDQPKDAGSTKTEPHPADRG